jgi:hypothetical protein
MFPTPLAAPFTIAIAVLPVLTSSTPAVLTLPPTTLPVVLNNPDVL